LCAEWEQNAPQLKCQEVSAHSSPSMWSKIDVKNHLVSF
jgi:hypothetical protein